MEKIIGKSTMKWEPSAVILQNILLCVQQKEETHSGLEQLEGE